MKLVSTKAVNASSTESQVTEPSGVVASQPVSSAVDNSPWYWEGNVQERVAQFLVESGFAVLSTADTAARTPGKDIIATAPDGTLLWVSVKGWPERSSNVQARHWFAGAVFDLLLYRDEDASAQLAIAFPDGFATYRNLAGRVRWLQDQLPFSIYWVDASGAVHVTP